LVVIGRYVDRFQFLEVMLSDRPPLAPPELFYQRMLAGDPMEAAEKAEEFLKERSLSDYYDEVALPGLTLAQNDILRGVLDAAQTAKIKDAVLEVVDDLADEEDRKGRREPTHDPEAAAAIGGASEEEFTIPVLTAGGLAPAWQSPAPVLCAAGRGPLDEAVAAMLVQLFGKHGLNARVENADAIATGGVARLDTTGIVLVCLSSLDASGTAHMRYAIRRLRRKLPQATMLVGCWTSGADAAAIGERSVLYDWWHQGWWRERSGTVERGRNASRPRGA
jgi:hypothetical protein